MWPLETIKRMNQDKTTKSVSELQKLRQEVKALKSEVEVLRKKHQEGVAHESR
mgnify:CR=1 FL=1